MAAPGRDGPWRRLPWLLPAALLLSLPSIAIFLRLLAGPPMPPAPPPIEVAVIEEPPAAPSVAAPPPPEFAPPPPTLEPPPPEPAPEARQVSPPPPAPKPARRQRPPPAVPAPPVATAPPPPAAAPAAIPGGGSMGARAIYRPLPEIPDALRHRGLDLVAVARFRVAADGSAEVALIEPTPDPRLNRALLETLRTWRFFPAVEDGRPAASSLDIRIPISVR